MRELSFQDIKKRIEQIPLPGVDLIIGIADGGVIPAALVAAKTDGNIRILRLSYRGDDNKPIHASPVITGEIEIPPDIDNILIVDDVSVSGKTLDAVKKDLVGIRWRRW